MSTTKPALEEEEEEEEVVVAACGCCGLTEECTSAYIAAVRGRYLGRWICGLCAEAVDDETRRPGRPVSTADALDRHARFSRSLRRSRRRAADSPESLVAAVARVLRRSLDSPAPAEDAAAAVASVRRRSSVAR
ncbi:uncharacterized protein LOC109728691 [Ananas comosus]|uniref:Uncharacterized protein LOC109728691 n=1 Tax=Ananas comosus TaxID=4615 RepID=A0A6P5H1C9_ANACO|nr:uncharacterized protein LOC109728691 [Ananas comosus]